MIENLNQQRSKEQELQIKLKQKDGQLAQLEMDLKRQSGNNRTLDSKVVYSLHIKAISASGIGEPGNAGSNHWH